MILIDLLNILDVVGIVAFAVSGAITAIQKRFDLFGVLFIAAVTAVGGGMTRDIILGSTPPAALMAPRDLLVALCTGVGIFLFAGAYRPRNSETGEILIAYTDALGLGVFTAIGAAKAYIVPDYNILLVVMTGMLTGVGGGMLRDVLTKEVPFVLRKEVYATASIAGALVFYAANKLVGGTTAGYLCFFVTTGIRIVAIRKKLKIPRASLRKPR